ncbi:hypothetical protein [Candidatus Lokiarchaeum ossiferum]|uniref:hypothetical protein n=1 Tax=Candidatus Lokiarchaeum ossiferum TaxID=2951803 RepID=UPI00352C39FD
MTTELPSFSRKELQSAGLNMTVAQKNDLCIDKRRKSCFEENVTILKSLEIKMPKGFKGIMVSKKETKSPANKKIEPPKKKVIKKEEPIKKVQDTPKKIEVATPSVEVPTMKNKKAEIIDYILSQKISQETEASLTKLKKADLLAMLK